MMGDEKNKIVLYVLSLCFNAYIIQYIIYDIRQMSTPLYISDAMVVSGDSDEDEECQRLLSQSSSPCKVVTAEAWTLQMDEANKGNRHSVNRKYFFKLMSGPNLIRDRETSIYLDPAVMTLNF